MRVPVGDDIGLKGGGETWEKFSTEAKRIPYDKKWPILSVLSKKLSFLTKFLAYM